jgi:hypothetical protein
MTTKPLCIYHGNCADGFTAAWAVRKALGEDVEFYPGVHQNPPPDCAGRDVIMVDFSYKRPVLDEMFRSAASLLILDHHKTAAEDLTEYRPPYGGAGWKRHLQNTAQDEMENCPQPYALFDMDRSGAQIAWDFFHPEQPRPLLVDYVGDRDLWRFALTASREVNAFVFAHEYTFKNWDYLDAMMRDHMGVQDVADMGGAIEKKHHKDVAELVGVTRREMILGGHWVPVANVPYTLTSDAGHLMCDPYASPNLQGEMVTPPFAACYWDTPVGRVFSLRSRDDGADVSAIAKQYGGGGHARAAGFRMPIGWEGDQAS